MLGMFLESLTGSVEAPADWATEHNHYLYGIPKHGTQPKSTAKRCDRP